MAHLFRNDKRAQPSGTFGSFANINRFFRPTSRRLSFKAQ